MTGNSRKALQALCVVLCLAPTTAGGVEPQYDAVDIVKYRQFVMKALDAHMEAVRSVVVGKADYWHQVGDHAVAISGMSRAMLQLFPHWTGPGKVKTEAMKTFWARWPDFQTAALRFNAEAAGLVTAVSSIDRRAIVGQFKKVEHACAACHEQFLKPVP